MTVTLWGKIIAIFFLKGSIPTFSFLVQCCECAVLVAEHPFIVDVCQNQWEGDPSQLQPSKCLHYKTQFVEKSWKLFMLLKVRDHIFTWRQNIHFSTLFLPSYTLQLAHLACFAFLKFLLTICGFMHWQPGVRPTDSSMYHIKGEIWHFSFKKIRD